MDETELRPAAPRIPPVPLPEWPAQMRQALAVLHPPNPRHPPTERRPGDPKGLNVLGTLAHHPELAQAFNTFNGHVLSATTLTGRQRELIVLRIAAVRGCEYEWVQHAILADKVGLDAADVDRIAVGRAAPGWSDLERALVVAVDELPPHARVGDATWAVLSAELDQRQFLDLIFTVGAYDVIAMMLLACRTELDEDLAARRSSGGPGSVAGG
jgi:AhpD family alkylhydroperoxidase